MNILPTARRVIQIWLARSVWPRGHAYFDRRQDLECFRRIGGDQHPVALVAHRAPDRSQQVDLIVDAQQRAFVRLAQQGLEVQRFPLVQHAAARRGVHRPAKK
jgi:hypothetical protein